MPGPIRKLFGQVIKSAALYSVEGVTALTYSPNYKWVKLHTAMGEDIKKNNISALKTSKEVPMMFHASRYVDSEHGAMIYIEFNTPVNVYTIDLTMYIE